MKNYFEFCQLFFSEGISEHKDPNIWLYLILLQI